MRIVGAGPQDGETGLPGSPLAPSGHGAMVVPFRLGPRRAAVALVKPRASASRETRVLACDVAMGWLQHPPSSTYRG